MSISSLSNLALDTTLDALSLLGLSGEQQLTRRRRRERRKQRERHLDDALVPLPSKRERSLTLPLAEEFQTGAEEETKKQKTELQSQSALFSKLPLEIRMRIYATFFSHQRLSILKDERLRYVKWIAQDRHLLPLLLTCRRIYSEAVDLLYSQNDFYFNDLDTIWWFASTVLPRRLSIVRFLFIEWDCVCYWIPGLRVPPPYDKYTWFKVWQIIASMEGLRELRVRLWNGPGMDRETEIQVFQPLREVKMPKVFDLELPWECAWNEEDEDPHADAPFTIIRVKRDYDPTA